MFNYNTSKKRKTKKFLNHEEIMLARQMFEDGVSQKRIAEKLGVCAGTISHKITKYKKSMRQEVEQDKPVVTLQLPTTEPMSFKKIDGKYYRQIDVQSLNKDELVELLIATSV